jgi:hypothetical protein
MLQLEIMTARVKETSILHKTQAFLPKNTTSQQGRIMNGRKIDNKKLLMQYNKPLIYI